MLQELKISIAIPKHLLVMILRIWSQLHQTIPCLVRPIPNFQPCVTDTEDINLRKRWRGVQAATDMFWHRWLKEYVPLLTKRKKWNVKNRNFQVGGLVLIAETGVPRSTWPLARIIEVKISSDSTLRVAEVKSHHRVYVRPTVSLCLLKES